MRVTRAFSRPVERQVMRVDIATIRLDASYREMLLEASLILATSLAGVAAIWDFVVVAGIAVASAAAR
jgi:hypothetical protein